MIAHRLIPIHGVDERCFFRLARVFNDEGRHTGRALPEPIQTSPLERLL